MARISRKHALNLQELDFCKRYSAGLNAAEAYRRAFLTDGNGNVKDMSSKEVSRRAKTLLKQDYIEDYLEEIGRPTSDQARSVLAEQALFGEDIHARRAAEKILEQEDKLGFRDAVEKWAEILCEIGAEVEVPLPGECQNCGSPLYARAPMSAMFKKGEGN